MNVTSREIVRLFFERAYLKSGLILYHLQERLAS